ncbi:two-partner secretion domain-containing protein [Psychrobacter jeotgali]|uniref:two-partner secretion domain-containing protein n=1 Tax=Psychrobacter jeotgali TaxID=179010 RepID=UPI001918A45B|nr:hemagglutinin repeat-containing protein [Psychrobacter jeotgali]
MNAQCYRVIFNKARGMLMVVSESVRSQGKTSNPSEGGSAISQVAGGSQTSTQVSAGSRYQGGKLMTLRSHLLLALGLATIIGSSVSNSAYADTTNIVADRNAAANQQAVIINTSSGKTQVNIQTPSAAGVSRNVFSKFDVGQDGAILNNSRTNAQTQLAGWVEGNPYLARGEARVILNEVNSSDPSRLTGFTEIAGGRAELIIANPAGITCAGCGFINAARTTLTTGNALMDQDRLTGFDIKEGNIRVDGDGLDTSGSDYTQILAKTTEINAAVYANTLDVITGNNSVSYETDGADSIITPKSSTGSNQATGVALDVSALGAMYAGKIRLIGTDKGMGVTNAGSIIASSGSLQLDSNGNLINSGSLIANQGKVDIANKGNRVDNSGTIASSRASIDIDSGALSNSGVISSYDTLTAQQTGSIDNSGEIAAGSFDVNSAELNNSGKLLQTGTGDLSIATQQLINKQGGVIGRDLYPDDTTNSPTVTPSKTPPTTANNGSSVEASTDGNTPSSETPETLPIITQNGRISTDSLTNTGSIYTNDNINVSADSIANQGKSSLAVSSLNIANNGSTINTDSRLQLDSINWQLANFDNSRGQITALNDIAIQSANQIMNTQGRIAAVGDIDLKSQHQFDNTKGVVESNGTITTQSSALDNTQGRLSSQGGLTINADGNLINTQGRLNSNNDLTINTARLSNDTGNINAQGNLDIAANTLNNSGQMYGQANNQITIKDALQNSGLIASQADTKVKAGTITQTASGSLIAGMQTDGSLLESGNAALSVTAKDKIVSQGKQIATGDMALSGSSVSLDDSVTQAHNITMRATTGNLSNQKATIVAKENLTLDSAQGTLNNQSGEISAHNFDVKAKSLNNTDGKMTQTGNQDFMLSLAEGIDNTRGRIASNASNLTVNTNVLDNSSGAIVQTAQVSPSLSITADRVINNQGQVLSLGDQTWQVATGVDNQNGVIQAQRFDISANNVDNTDGRLIAVTNQDDANQEMVSQLRVTGDINNTKTDSIEANKAIISSNTGRLNINASGLTNEQGQISSVKDLTLTTDSLINSGSVYSQDNLDITNQGEMSNTGSIAAQSNTTITTGSLNQSTAGQLIAGLSPEGELSGSSNLTVTSRAQQTNAGTNIATGDISLKSSELDLTGSRNQSRNLSLTATAGDISLDKAVTKVTGMASLNTKSKLSNDGGVLQAGGFDWQVNKLSNIAGTINQTGSQDFSLVTNGTINNQNGVIGGKAESLTINTQGQLNNNQGSIVQSADVDTSANSGATIIADSLLNQQGKLISNGKMTATINKDFDNTEGGVQAEALQVSAGKLTNLNGQLVSQSGDLQLVATDITNQGDKAYIQSGNNLTIEARQLSNSDKATLMAQGAATITADDSFNNASGAVTASNESMTINGGILNNDAQIASVNKGVTINTSTINNTALGRLQAATDTTIDTEQSLNNQGLIATTKALKVATGGDLNNQTGTLSADAIDLLSQQGINNDGGLIIQSGTDEVLLVESKGLLSNKNTKTAANSDKQLGIITNSDVSITSSSLDNLSGLITANNLTIKSLDDINNKQGQLQASEQLAINATGNATLNNQDGQIGANKVNLIIGDASSGRINNNGAGSLIQAATDLALTTGTLNNQSTKQSTNSKKSQGILAGNTLAIHASAINNTGGQLLANDKTTIKASNQLNNQSGTINSHDVVISDSNTAGRRLVVTNNQGLINANKDLSIKAKGYSNAGGTISAVDQADINVSDSIYYGQGDTINAADLKLTTQGNFTNSGQLSGQNALTIDANNIANLKGAEITSNGTTALNTSANIDNRGLINGINTYLDAGNAVNNYSNGRIYGDHVAIETNTLNNTPDVFTKTEVENCEAGPGCLVENGIYYRVSSEPDPVIAARRRLDIGVNTLNNNPNQARSGIFNEDFNGQAQIISNGELHIAGSLDRNHHAVGKAENITNKGASIESVGDMSISTDKLNNVNADFKSINTSKAISVKQFTVDNQKFYDSDEIEIHRGGHKNKIHDLYIKETDTEHRNYNEWSYDEILTKKETLSSDPSRIISGQGIEFDLDGFNTDKSQIIAGSMINLQGKVASVDAESTQVIPKYSYEKVYLSNHYEDNDCRVNGPFGACWGSYRVTKTNTYNATQPVNPKVTGTPYQLKILNSDNQAIGVYDTAVTITNNDISSKINIDDPKANVVNQIKNAIDTLTQDKFTVTGQSDNTSVNATSLEDATNLLSKFAKAENNQLTDAQKQQLQALIDAQKSGNKVDKAAIDNLISSIDDQIAQTASEEIRTTGNAPTLPNSGLYGINPDSNANYLIETDSAFANYKNWLSSDYMLNRLQFDPAITQKRLGDGYYEQQYIRDQIMMLTGRYYLADYRSLDAQYKGLMDTGITTAQTLNLRPGIALTDEQVARLTTDMVWLVQQEITLADGTNQKVLVPKVYTRQAVNQIDGTGNLIAADRIDMQLSGDLTNQGNIVGHKQVKINASNLTNQNGGLIAGDYVQIDTVNDLNNLGGTLQANNAMQLDAGGDFNNESLTYTTSAAKGASNGARTGIAQIASIYVGDGLKGKTDAEGNPLTTFIANVGGNTTFAAGRLNNLGGSSLIDTQGDVALNAINTSYQTNSIGDANNYFKQGESIDVGSTLTGNSDIIIQSGNNITGTAIQISSDSGTVGIKAGNSITFTEGRNTKNLSTATKTTSKSFFSKETTQDRFDSQSDNAISSNIEGNQVAMQAGNDISLTGTNAISDKGTSLTAGGNIDILAAQNTSSESTFSQTKKSGLFGADGGMGFTIGKQQSDDTNAQSALTHTASNVGAIDGNVIIDAGGSYQQTGSNLIAGMGDDSSLDINDANRGNTVVRAKEINIDSVKDIYTNQSESKFKQTGLTVSVSNSLIDSARAIDDLADAAGNTQSVRMKGLASTAGLLKTKALAKQANSAGYDLLDGDLKGVGNTRIQATIGSQKSQSNSSSYTEVNQGSSITTNNLALIATGAGADSNIDINGSNLDVTNNALFQADNDFNVSGVAQNSQTRSTNKSSNAAIGGYASTGNGFGITANAGKGKGYANSDSVTYANSNINVGNTTTLDIGNDLNLKGGILNTDKIQGAIGGDVNIESLQDTAAYDSKQKNAGFTLDVALEGAGSSLSLNGGKTDINADYKAVGEQSGIFANEADLVTEGKGNFIGGVFTTSADAQANGKSNIVFKQGVTSQDINNTTSYEGDAISVGLSAGKIKDKPQATMSGLGYGTDSDSDSSITKGGVSGYNDPEGILTTENRETLGGKLESVFDASRVNEELGAQTIITKEFGKEAPKAVGDFANNRIKAIRADATLSDAEKNAAIAKWDEGGIYRVAAHTALGALATGSVEGALTTGGVAAAAPTLNEVQTKLAKALVDKGMSADIAEGAASGVVSLALLGAGSAAGLDTSSTATGVNVDANNRQLHPSEISQLKQRAKILAKGDKDTEEYWLNLLYGAAYAKVDAQGNNKFNQYKQGINNGIDASSQLGAELGNAYLADYQKAESIINEMSNNAKGSVYLKDNKGNRLTDNKGNDIGFLNADSNQYNYNTLLTNTYPPSPPNGGTSLRSNDPRRNLGTALDSQTKAAASQVANVGSGAITPVHPEDYALLGYGAAKTVTNIAKSSAVKGATKNTLPWGTWSSYPKKSFETPKGPQDFALIGDRYYSSHAVGRMQPSNQRYSSGISSEEGLRYNTGTKGMEPGILNYDGREMIRGRSISPNNVEAVINNSKPIKQNNGNWKHTSGDVEVILSPDKKRVITIIN